MLKEMKASSQMMKHTGYLISSGRGGWRAHVWCSLYFCLFCSFENFPNRKWKIRKTPNIYWVPGDMEGSFPDAGEERARLRGHVTHWEEDGPLGRRDTGPRQAPCSGSTWHGRACILEPLRPSTQRERIACEAHSPRGGWPEDLPDRSHRSRGMSRSGRTCDSLWAQDQGGEDQGVPGRRVHTSSSFLSEISRTLD